jgi:uncharacterized protein (DUF952 family)
VSPIFKICHRDDWAKADNIHAYLGSEKDREDGYLHFSTASQLAGTLAKYYADADDLLLVAVDPGALGAALKYETSRDGELFPHLYAPLLYDCVKWAADLRRNEDGEFVLPEDVSG